MKYSGMGRHGLLPGALAGLIGGLLFGVAMVPLGMLPTIASLVRTDSVAAGFIVHMGIAAIVGAGFGILVWQQQSGAGETLFWGLTYGTVWWLLGPLTLMPLLLDRMVTWNVTSAHATFSSLIGHLVYGASTGLTFVVLRQEQRALRSTCTRGALLRGALAGAVGGGLIGIGLGGHDEVLAFLPSRIGDARQVGGLLIVLIGLVLGTGFALLYPRPTAPAGPTLIRGVVYGFFWWVAGGLTVFPLLTGAGLAWSLEAARAAFASLPVYLLVGSTVALVYQGLDRVVLVLFSDAVLTPGDEGIGIQGMRVMGRGAGAGLIGGVLFTLVMVRIGLLPVIAELVGATSALTGVFVHLVIANLIGASYGLLFRQQSYDVGSALGWGVSYGFVWWIMGALTLMPMFLGSEPQWTVEAAGQLFPSLIGHLAYGAALGVVYYLLEARYSPWWITRTQAEAARNAQRKEQVLTSAPALWVLVVMIALTLPVILGPAP